MPAWGAQSGKFRTFKMFMGERYSRFLPLVYPLTTNSHTDCSLLDSVGLLNYDDKSSTASDVSLLSLYQPLINASLPHQVLSADLFLVAYVARITCWAIGTTPILFQGLHSRPTMHP
ncbi:hypothetical protein FRC08_005800 [Ceratobasidium sp. 394]|nr:hypothetical protein FRC08_005800 [Ceratobasidium sp. 394]